LLPFCDWQPTSRTEASNIAFAFMCVSIVA
jgi:hypothetical protein